MLFFDDVVVMMGEVDLDRDLDLELFREEDLEPLLDAGDPDLDLAGDLDLSGDPDLDLTGDLDLSGDPDLDLDLSGDPDLDLDLSGDPDLDLWDPTDLDLDLDFDLETDLDFGGSFSIIMLVSSELLFLAS